MWKYKIWDKIDKFEKLKIFKKIPQLSVSSIPTFGNSENGNIIFQNKFTMTYSDNMTGLTNVFLITEERFIFNRRSDQVLFLFNLHRQYFWLPLLFFLSEMGAKVYPSHSRHEKRHGRAVKLYIHIHIWTIFKVF